VQEFCRVLFDAIDQSFRLRLPNADANMDGEHTSALSMTDIYEGVSQGFVKCLTCG